MLWPFVHWESVWQPLSHFAVPISSAYYLADKHTPGMCAHMQHFLGKLGYKGAQKKWHGTYKINFGTVTFKIKTSVP